LTRKLILLDLALIAVLCLLGWQMRREWLWANAREQALWHATIKPVSPAALAPLPKVAPLAAMSYADVAQMNLFSKDRNPAVIIEPVVPPPAPVVPPFPVARGVMLWKGMPPTVVMSERPGGIQKGYHPGEKIGEWKIASVDNQYVVLEWSGQEFKKRLDELMDRTPVPLAEAPQSGSPYASTAPRAQNLGDSIKSGPGMDVGNNVRSCIPGDKSPAGAIQDGWRKILAPSPMGELCHWEPAR
jgi:hypothetical protein